MLYRFREAQAVQLGLVKPKERRPYLASDCNSLKDAEKWRQQIIREISRKVSKIQDGKLLFDIYFARIFSLLIKVIFELYSWPVRLSDQRSE